MNERRAPATDRIDAQNEILAENWRNASRTLPVTIEVPTGDEIWEAAMLKSRFPLAYADALAQKYNCPLLTGDAEFRHVDQLQIDWIGVK